MKIRRIIAALLSLLCLAALSLSAGCDSGSASLSRILGEGKMVVGLTPDSLPMSYEDGSGAAGLSADLARELAKRLNVEVEFVFLDADEVLDALENDSIDVYMNMPYPGQKEAAKFLTVDGLLDCRQIIAVREDSDISRLYDLAGKRAAVISGSDADDALTQAAILRADLESVEYAESSTELIGWITQERVDVIVIDEPLYLYTVNRMGHGCKVLDETLGERDYILALKLREDSLGERLKQLYSDMKSDGTFDTIVEGYLGASREE